MMKTSHLIILAIVAYIAYANRAKIAAYFTPLTTSTAQMGVLQTVEDKFAALEKPLVVPISQLRVTRGQR